MARKVVTMFTLKNGKGEYYTGNWREEDRWDANSDCAETFSSIGVIIDDINANTRDQEESGNDWKDYKIEDGIYTVETRIIIKTDD